VWRKATPHKVKEYATPYRSPPLPFQCISVVVSRATPDAVDGLAFAVSNLAARQINTTLASVLHANDGTEAFLRLSDSSTTHTDLVAHGLLSAQSMLPAVIELLYLADPAGRLNAVGRNNKYTNPATDPAFFWMFVNSTEDPMVMYGNVSYACGALDRTCPIGDLAPSSDELFVTTRPWYQTVRPIPGRRRAVVDRMLTFSTSNSFLSRGLRPSRRRTTRGLSCTSFRTPTDRAASA